MVHQGAFEGHTLRPFLRAGLAVIALTLGAGVLATNSASATEGGVQGPPCLTGTTYNKLTKMCETAPTHTCEAGFEYDSYNRICLGPYDCPAGLGFNGELCTNFADPPQTAEVVCPLGGTFSRYLYHCVGAAPVVTCPEGFTLSEASDGYYSYELCSGPHLRGRSGPT